MIQIGEFPLSTNNIQYMPRTVTGGAFCERSELSSKCCYLDSRSFGLYG